MTYLFEVHFLDSIGNLKVKEVESENGDEACAWVFRYLKPKRIVHVLMSAQTYRMVASGATVRIVRRMAGPWWQVEGGNGETALLPEEALLKARLLAR